VKVLIDIGHPAHVHYYRNLARELENSKCKVFWTVKDIPVAKKLLDYYGFEYIVLPKKADRIPGKVLRQFQYNLKLLRLCQREKIDIAVGTSVSVAHVSKIFNVNSIVFDDDDDDVQPLVTRYVNPLADVLLSPEALKGKRKRQDTIYYAGYHELAYLHPKRFTPDPGILDKVGLKQSEPFFIMRFNAFKAHHDVGVKGLSLEQKLELIEILKPLGKIFITTERNIEPELNAYQLKVSPEKIHSLMAYATMFLGDSQTMTSEASIIGTPAIKCNTLAGKLSVPNELENIYDLCYSFKAEQFELMLKQTQKLLGIKNLNQVWKNRRNRMLKEKIDVSGFMIWFIENYPQSFKIMTQNPEYQNNFK